MKKSIYFFVLVLFAHSSLKAQYLTLNQGDSYPNEDQYRFATFYDGALTSTRYLNFGKINTTYNTGEIGFTYLGDQSSDNYLSFGFYGQTDAQRFYIKANGNVGIGIADPTSKLHVLGGIKVGTSAVFDPDPMYYANESYIAFADNVGPGYSEDFIGYRDNIFYFRDSPGGGDESQPGISISGGLWMSQRTDMGASSTEMEGNQFIAFADPVGPTYTEDFMGYKDNTFYLADSPGGADQSQPDLVVKGKIATTEIKVNVDAMPDYVFEETYDLKPLSEVAQYISENKHLPEIPSAAEVEANEGINLGEMNAKLLQKIEELTLYLIEQNQKLEELQREVELLKLDQKQ